MLLFFLRHADAVQNPLLNDSERPLSDLGRLQAETVGRYLKSSGTTIDRVFSSPLARAVETSEIVGRTLGIGSIEQTEYLVPGTRKKQLLDFINAAGAPSVLMTGHEPHISQTVSLLLSGTETLALEFRKCSLACLVVSEPVRAGHAMLQWLLTSEQMERLHR